MAEVTVQEVERAKCEWIFKGGYTCSISKLHEYLYIYPYILVLAESSRATFYELTDKVYGKF